MFGGGSFDENDVTALGRLQIVGHILEAVIFRVSYTEKFVKNDVYFLIRFFVKLHVSLSDRIT